MPRLVRIPDVPFGITDEESLEILLDAMVELAVSGVQGVEMIGIRNDLKGAGLLETFDARWRELRFAMLTEEELAMIRWNDEMNERRMRIYELERLYWPGSINYSYINPLEAFGLRMVLPAYIFGAFQIAPIPGEAFGIHDEAGLRILVNALIHLAEISYPRGRPAMFRQVAVSLYENGLWHSFIEMARDIYNAELQEIQPLMQQLEDLGVVAAPVFYDIDAMTPHGHSNCRFSTFNPLVGGPRSLQVAIHPYNPFAIADDAHLEILAEVLNFNFRTKGFNISALQQELEARDLWERFLTIQRPFRIRAMELELELREQRFGIQ